MKKWLIFAVIAALFAVVMFPACGDKGGGDNGSAASNVQVYKVTDSLPADLTTAAVTALNVVWDGAEGYEYSVYFEKLTPEGKIETVSSSILRGQTLYGFKAKKTSAGAYDNPGWEATQDGTEKNRWAILLTTGTDGYSGTLNDNGDDHGGTAAGTLWTTLSAITGEFRVVVVGAYPGGFPIDEQKVIVYSNWVSVEAAKIAAGDLIP
jgi:hypothetical protein